MHRSAGEGLPADAESAAALEFLSSRVFWFTFEFGVAWEDGELHAFGAGLLSSFGELDAFRDAQVRPFDLTTMGTTDYDITVYQPTLFCADSFAQVVDVVGGFFAECDDDTPARLTHHAKAS